MSLCTYILLCILLLQIFYKSSFLLSYSISVLLFDTELKCLYILRFYKILFKFFFLFPLVAPYVLPSYADKNNMFLRQKSDFSFK
jgi:hypothetical protein